MEEAAVVPMEQTESVAENTKLTETKKKGPRGRGRSRGGRGYARGKMQGRALNSFGPIRRGIGRMRSYPDARGRRGAQWGSFFPPFSPTRRMMRAPFLPPPPRYGLPLPPLPPPPPEPMGFRGRLPFPRARGMPLPRGHFPPPRGVT
ncbi:uncharacterized protein LOC128351350 isoform X2 [Hemicordylus capensis]|uniref:uncharacterized protein LOC128351350 isoform X2 n=1 Tax=Hemicordylus capensis TaxID=884348 RepID=UPI0023033666|nr:uncharacterized protein LOC128351350 isoform X2 [Hemicordylus capensis]